MDMCPRCFEMNSAGAEFCQECGAPLDDRPNAEGSDQAVYADLARTNLFRMRGDYKGAADVCLGILRRYPNNATAHTLMGDIYAEQGDLKHAVEWYEMALDLVPDSAVDRAKLDQARQRLKDLDSRSTAKELGIPERAPRSGQFAMMMTVTILAIAIAAFLLGGRFQGLSAGRDGRVVTDPIQVPENAPPSPSTVTEPVVPETPPPGPAAIGGEPAPTAPSLLARLQALMPSNLRLTDVKEDPRGPRYLLSVESSRDEDPAVSAAEVALAVFAGASEPTALTVRVGRAGGLVYVADADRTGADAQLKARAAVTAGTGPPKADPSFLQNPWTAAPAAAP